MNYLWKHATLTMIKYQRQECKHSNDYMDLYYTQLGLSCIDPHELDKKPFEANGKTYTFSDEHHRSVSLSVGMQLFDHIGNFFQIYFLLKV